MDNQNPAAGAKGGQGKIKMRKKKAIDVLYQPGMDVLRSWIKKPHEKVGNIMEEFIKNENLRIA